MAEGDGVSVAVGNDDETQPLLPVKAAKGDDIKSHMANERTFFKWLFIGTLQIFLTIEKESFQELLRVFITCISQIKTLSFLY